MELFYGGTGTCRGKNDTVAGLLTCLAKRGEKAVSGLAKKIYHPVRPAVCGDGDVTGPEECDPNAPRTCSFQVPVCHPQGCFCTFQGCGNGIIEAGEDCDHNTFPNGGHFDQFCTGSCFCQGLGSPSKAFLDEPRNLIDWR